MAPSRARCCWSTSTRAASIPDEELKAKLAKSHLYKEWLERTQIVLEELPDAPGEAALSNLALLDRQQASATRRKTCAS